MPNLQDPLNSKSFDNLMSSQTYYLRFNLGSIVFGVLPASASFSMGASTLNTSHLLFTGGNQSQFTVVEKSPAFVFGEYVIAPMIAKVSACFSRISSTFKYFNRAFQFPMAEGAKIAPSLNTEMKFLEKVAGLMSKQEELSDANRKINDLIAEGNAHPDMSAADFGKKAFDIMTNALSFASGPVSFIADTFIDGVREGQLEIALEGIEKLKKQLDVHNQQLDKLRKQKEKRQQIAKLNANQKALLDKISELEEAEQNKINTLTGIHQELREKMKTREQLKARTDQLTPWLAGNYKYLEARNKEMQDYNSKVQQYKQYLTTGQLQVAADKNTAFQTEMSALRPQIQAAVDELNEKSASLVSIQESLDRLVEYHKTTEESRAQFNRERVATIETVNQIEQQIDSLLTHDEL